MTSPSESVEHLVVGAGPAGLRAAQVLAEAGREVLVLEKKEQVGPKTCAGGLTVKSVRELAQLGLPADAGLESVGHAAFAGGRAAVLDPELVTVRTVPRGELGAFQHTWTRRAGAEVRPATPAARLDLEARTAAAGGRVIRWRHLIGADGADSAVRRALGLPSPRAYFAAEYNLPGIRLGPLRIVCDPSRLANGYFWVFPHASHTSIGAVGMKRLIPPAALRRYLDARIARLGLRLDGVRFEGATLEVEYRGLHFAGGVHLAGDAAGMPSALTAEGIYAALVTGEEVARTILEPAFPAPKTASWLRVKRRHDRLAALMRRRAGQALAFPALAAVALWKPARRPMAAWFLEG